ncbi:ANR family transcriptional regulator [Pasteurella sp. PK-2025]|uniref:ANR family transcriptional regulator n=1 Tax=unclassified Pasteurella TaxID=2621516 RepID=UPI003C72047C
MAEKANKLSFKELSQLASEVERAGDYSYAAELWRRAAKLARKQVNLHWCIARYAFLDRWGTRLKKEAKNG